MFFKNFDEVYPKKLRLIPRIYYIINQKFSKYFFLYMEFNSC